MNPKTDGKGRESSYQSPEERHVCLFSYVLYLSIDLSNFMARVLFLFLVTPVIDMFYLLCIPLHTFCVYDFLFKPISSFYFCFIFFTLFTLFSMTPTEVSIVSIPFGILVIQHVFPGKICMLLVFFFLNSVISFLYSLLPDHLFSLGFSCFFISCSWIEVFALYFYFVVNSNGVFNLAFLP